MQIDEEIYRRYAGYVFHYLLSVTGNRDLAKELTQETFFQAIKNIGRFDGSCRLSTWLCAIAKNQFSADYITESPITRIILEDWIIYENGINIPANVSKVYAAKHEYVGDMSKNGRSAIALEIAGDLGPFSNQLKTFREPYSWIIYLREDLSGRNTENLNRKLEYYGAMLIATIDNLDTVCFVYNKDGQKNEFSYSEADADLHYGSSVKKAAETVSGLYELMKDW